MPRTARLREEKIARVAVGVAAEDEAVPMAVTAEATADPGTETEESGKTLSGKGWALLCLETTSAKPG